MKALPFDLALVCFLLPPGTMVRKRRCSGFRGIVVSAFLALTAGQPAIAQDTSGRRDAPTAVPAQLPETEAVLLGEAYRLAEELGDEIWPGFGRVPFPVVLVAGEHEFLVGWDRVLPSGFEEVGTDPRLGRSVAFRGRSFAPELAASFPAFGPPAVVVIGTSEATERNPTEWILTLLHEHMHQLQYAAPGYYSGVDALDLAQGDETGMWMLDFPFPYEDEAVARRLAELAEATRRSVLEDASPEVQREPWLLLRGLLDSLDPPTARYLSLQLWQEGIARYLELRAARLAAERFEPSVDFVALDASDSWRMQAEAVRERILGELEAADLAANGRVSFYPLGAALGILLERHVPGWEAKYLEEKFAIDRIVSSD